MNKQGPGGGDRGGGGGGGGGRWGARSIQPEQHLQALFTTSNQSSGKQSKSHDITRSKSQSDNGS